MIQNIRLFALHGSTNPVELHRILAKIRSNPDKLPIIRTIWDSNHKSGAINAVVNLGEMYGEQLDKVGSFIPNDFVKPVLTWDERPSPDVVEHKICIGYDAIIMKLDEFIKQ